MTPPDLTRDIPHPKRKLFALVLICAVLYMLMNMFFVESLMAGSALRSPLKDLVLGFFLFLGFCGALFGLSAVPKAMKWPVLILMIFSLTVNFGLFATLKTVVTRPAITWLLSEFGNLENAMSEFGLKIFLSLVAGVSIVLLFAKLQQQTHLLCDHLFDSATMYKVRRTALGIFISVPVTFAGASSIWPSGPSLAESNIYLYSLMASLQSAPAQQQPEFAAQPANAAAEKIVMIMDESIRIPAFVNGVQKTYGARMVLFPHGYSTANCSAASNALLRWGVEKKNLTGTTDPRANPTLWSYATHAGYRTTMIDGQMRNATQNYIRPSERAQINTYLPMDTGVDTDVRVAQEVLRRIRQPGREFILIVKRGAHFPYEGNFPPAAHVATNTKEQNYLAAVQYSTGQFFDTLMAQSKNFSNTLFFYTSDHGEYLGEGSPHCRQDFMDETYQVPVAVFGGESALKTSIAAASKCWSGGVSHQNIRTTVLEALGYPKNALEADNFPSLSSCQHQENVPRFLGNMPFPTSKYETIAMTQKNVGLHAAVAPATTAAIK